MSPTTNQPGGQRPWPFQLGGQRPMATSTFTGKAFDQALPGRVGKDNHQHVCWSLSFPTATCADRPDINFGIVKLQHLLQVRDARHSGDAAITAAQHQGWPSKVAVNIQTCPAFQYLTRDRATLLKGWITPRRPGTRDHLKEVARSGATSLRGESPPGGPAGTGFALPLRNEGMPGLPRARARIYTLID